MHIFWDMSCNRATLYPRELKLPLLLVTHLSHIVYVSGGKPQRSKVIVYHAQIAPVSLSQSEDFLFPPSLTLSVEPGPHTVHLGKAM